MLQVGRKDDEGLSNYYRNIGGGALTFGFIAIAWRRKFGRKVYSLIQFISTIKGDGNISRLG